jgi:glycosyltransferase involved in cell wall biosynthesis
MSQRMRLLEVTALMPLPVVGGIEKVVHELSLSLQNKGHDVTLLACGKDSCTIQVENVKTVYVASWLSFWPDVAFPKNLGIVFRELRKCDLVHIHYAASIFGLFVLLLSKLMRKPLVLSVLAYLELRHSSDLFLNGLGFILGAIVTLEVKLSDLVHAKNIQDYSLLKRLKKGSIYIPDGTPEEYFRQAQNFQKSPIKTVLYIGRLHKLKGPQVLLRSIPYIIKVRNDFRVIVAGPDDGFKSKLLKITHELKIENYISFAGQVDEKKKLELYDLADIVVVPSIRDSVEAYSLVASEAWARKKFVVASRVGALKLRVEEGVNGYLFHPNDSRDLAQKILLALERDNYNFDLPQDVLSWCSIASKFEKVYLSILSARRTDRK